MNNFLTLSELTQKVITKLSMYRGTSTQKYAEDRIADTIISNYIDIISLRHWNFCTSWYKYNLSGENGVVVEDVSQDIKDFDDIEFISTEINPRFSLRRLHDSTNPYVIEGTTPLYYMNSKIDKKIFQVVPFNSTGVIYVRAKSVVREFNPETVVPFDSNYLIYKSCWDYCCDDGNSMTQIEKFKQLYSERLQILVAKENEVVLDYNDEIAYNPCDTWR